jgi:L-rhamnono-1,4-lactonase
MAEVRQKPIIDSHIHLFAESHLPRLSWAGELPDGHVLKRGNTVSSYKDATGGVDNLAGFVFLETDRFSGLADDQWGDALAEAAFLSRIAQGKPLEGEGHTAEDASLCVGVVPWAPVPAGPKALERYMDRLWELYPGECKQKVKGVRYLLQNKPAKVMLHADFISSLHWLGANDLSFDLGIDARSTGLHQLEEARTMMEQLYGSGSNLKIVINHFCKPNLRLAESEARAGHPDFEKWKEHMQQMASYKQTYMKLSGFFSELPPQSADDPANIKDLAARLRPWVEVVIREFSPGRIMFGSDWPVCNVGGPGPAKSWTHWRDTVSAILSDLNLTDGETARIWHGTAAEAYRISDY